MGLSIGVEWKSPSYLFSGNIIIDYGDLCLPGGSRVLWIDWVSASPDFHNDVEVTISVGSIIENATVVFHDYGAVTLIALLTPCKEDEECEIEEKTFYES